MQTTESVVLSKEIFSETWAQAGSPRLMAWLSRCLLSLVCQESMKTEAETDLRAEVSAQ